MSEAQKQHYVPQFILRQFLTDEEKEHVSVYDKHTEMTFITSIRNIMAERRFNDLTIDEYIISFEPVACAIEGIFMPT